MSSEKLTNKLSSEITRILRENNLSQAALASILGITESYVSQIISGKKTGISEQLAKLISAKFKVPVESLLEGRDLRSVVFSGELTDELRIGEKGSVYGEEFVLVPQMQGMISAGGGLVPDTTVEMRIAFRKDWVERRGNPENMSLIRVSGDSMEPTLQSGDLVLVDHGRNYVDPQGGIYAIAFDQTIMIKRIQVLHPSNKIKVISDNGRYESIETEPDQLRINGKIIWFGRELER